MQLKRKYKIIGILVLVVVLLVCVFNYMVRFSEQPYEELSYQTPKITTTSYGSSFNHSWIRKNKFGLYEMYVEGSPIQRGVTVGALSEKLIQKQEDFFIGQLETYIPSKIYQFFIRTLVAWFNKDLDNNISNEYLEEIYGVSRYASKKNDFVGPAFQRMVNYHGAHDIGHAVQNLNLVGCTSFGLWGANTVDNKLLIGRNFDFYVGDEFAEDKLIVLLKPDKGHGMLFVSWGGMMGVVSGMNDKGLTVTLNAAPSEIPYHTATPVSLIAREVLQYASTIDEAYKIIEKRNVFVSETFLIGSAIDKKAVVIEKTPETTAIYNTQDSKILCTNHFQSNELSQTDINKKQLKDNATLYRMNRLDELVGNKKHSVQSIVSVLRDQKGLGNEDLGMGNEGAVNQLIAHHSIVFSPEDFTVWISTNPYCLGEYVSYDLKKIFKSTPPKITDTLGTYNVAADSFLHSNALTQYYTYLKDKKAIHQLKSSDSIQSLESTLLKSNPNNYITYWTLANYWKEHNNPTKALEYLETGLNKVIPSGYDKSEMIKLQQKLNEK